MANVIELPIPVEALSEPVDQIMLKRGYVDAESLVGKTIKMKEFSEKYCGKKAPNWIRLFIFDEFPEVNVKNGGWVVNPRRTEEGSKTIFLKSQLLNGWMNIEVKLIGTQSYHSSGKDFKKMAARIRYLHRHKSEKQNLIINLINSSNCCTGINDYRFKPTRNIKKPNGNRTFKITVYQKIVQGECNTNGVHWYRSKWKFRHLWRNW